MKLKALLLAKGWTEEEISTAFANPKTLETLDEMFGTVTSERDTLKARDAEWQKKLETEYNPAISKAEQDAITARREAADAREQLKIAKDYGYLSSDDAEKKLADAAAEAARRNDPSNYDSKRHPTFDDVAKFADAEGQAIALANDLASEYQYYTGKPMHEYEATLNGQRMRGMRALREEAKQARKPLDLFVSEKFDFAGKQRAKQEEAQKAHDDQIRKEAEETVRREMAEKYGNPMLATPAPSRQPFMPAKPADGKQPWERGTSQELKVNRLKNALNEQMKSAAVH